MKENFIAINYDTKDYVIFIQSMKIGTYENKAINIILLYEAKMYLR